MIASWENSPRVAVWWCDVRRKRSATRSALHCSTSCRRAMSACRRRVRATAARSTLTTGAVWTSVYVRATVVLSGGWVVAQHSRGFSRERSFFMVFDDREQVAPRLFSQLK